jgi:hypothetical protein
LNLSGAHDPIARHGKEVGGVDKHSTGRANALKDELYAAITRTSTASPEAIYDLLADLRSHTTWGGEQQSKNYRLLSIEAPDGPAMVGTEFSTVGADPMGVFHDHSVVTEATPASLFVFVTEAHFTTTKDEAADWTSVHRYEIVAADSGCRVTYSIRVVRISALPGMLRLFNIPVLSRVLMHMAVRGPKRGVRNLTALAEQDDRRFHPREDVLGG